VSADFGQQLSGCQFIGSLRWCVNFKQLLERSNSDFKEFIQVCARNAQKSDSLENWQSLVTGLRQYTSIELEEAQFPVDVPVCLSGCRAVHIAS
jgi:hypothetical protein